MSVRRFFTEKNTSSNASPMTTKPTQAKPTSNMRQTNKTSVVVAMAKPSAAAKRIAFHVSHPITTPLYGESQDFPRIRATQGRASAETPGLALVLSPHG
jgi:hypothetical protein